MLALELLVASLTLGGLYALIAMGLTLQYGVALMMKASSSLTATTSAGICFSPSDRKALILPSPQISRKRLPSSRPSRGVTVTGFFRPMLLMLPTISSNTRPLRSRGLSTAI